MENLSLLDGRFYEWLGIPAAATDLRVPLVPLPLRMLAGERAGVRQRLRHKGTPLQIRMEQIPLQIMFLVGFHVQLPVEKGKP